MKNTLRQLRHSSQFMIGFFIFIAIFLMTIIYPLIVTDDPLAMVGRGTFFKPGTYISVSETITNGTSDRNSYTLNIEAASSGFAAKLPENDRDDMITWLVKFGGVAEGELTIADEDVDEKL